MKHLAENTLHAATPSPVIPTAPLSEASLVRLAVGNLLNVYSWSLVII